MNLQTLEELIRAVPLFSVFEPGELAEVMTRLHREQLEAGHRLFAQGDEAKDFWILGRGCAVELTIGAPGRPQALRTAVLQAGETLGEVALVDASAHSMSATVLHGGPALRLSGLDFSAMRISQAPLAFKMLRKIAFDLGQRVRQVTAKVAQRESLELPEPVRWDGAGHPDASALPLFRAFRNVPFSVTLALQQMLTEQQLPRASLLMREGDLGEAIFLVVSGRVALRWRWRSITNLGPGGVFGLLSVMDRGSSFASAVVTEQARVWRLGADDFEVLYRAHHPFAYELVDLVAKQLVARLHSLNAALISLGVGGAELDESLVMADFNPELEPVST